MYFFNRLSSLELTKPRVMKFQVQPTPFHSTFVEGKKFILQVLCPFLFGPDWPRWAPNWSELTHIGPELA